MPRCAGNKPDGTPCERIVGASQRYCYSHDETRREQRRRAASKAGRSKAGGELAQVKGELRALAGAVLAGRIDKGRASVATQALGVYLRAVEIERKIRETEELESRIEALEQARGEAGGSRWPA